MQTPEQVVQEKNRFINRLIIALVYLAIIWTVHMIKRGLNLDWDQWGVLPRTERGAWGILFMPFLHRDFAHLISNSAPLFVLFLSTLQFYPRIGIRVLLGVQLMGGGLVWAFARPSFHIGASGVVYGLGAFLFFSGWFRRDTKSMAIACIVAFLYGSMVWGVLPTQPDISWEGHLFGAFSGVLMAYLHRNVDRPKPYSWEEEEPAEFPNQTYWEQEKDEYRD